MFRFILLSLLLALNLGAEEEVLKVSLRFQIWVPQSEGGIMIEADPSLRRERIQEDLVLRQGESLLPFRCGELRRSAAVEYAGSAELLFHRSGEEEVVARCVLPSSGKYRVLLMKSGRGYQVFPIPIDSEKLTQGNLQMVNTTRRAISVQQHGKRAMMLRRGMTKVMTLAKPQEPTVHLTIRARRKGKWEQDFSRPYTLRKNARSVCFFYETKSSRRLQMKFFSGL